MDVESIAQSVSNLAIQFGDSDDDGNAMVSMNNTSIAYSKYCFALLVSYYL